MKKLLFLFSVLLISILAFGQQVPMNYVLIEVGTGTWCPSCPAAANGLEDMYDNGHDVAIIEYHGGDTYETNNAGTRLGLYNNTYFPTAYFNGPDEYVGGGPASSTNYSIYLDFYNNHISDLSSFSLDIDLFSADDINFTANIAIEKVDTYTGTNLKLFVAVTESNIEQAWQGMDHLMWVERDMFPSASGTSLDFSSTSTINEEINFEIDPSWDLTNCELVVFIQDMTSKEVLQVNKSVMDLPAGTTNVLLQAINNPINGDVICETEIAPSIQFKNKGTSTLTSIDFITMVNDENVGSYTWTGDLEFGEIAEIELDMISYTQLAENELKITAQNPNGVADEYPENNSDSLTFYKSDETSTKIILEMNSGVWGFEISFILYNSNGDIIAEKNDFDNSEYYKETFILPIDDCYYFELHDSYGTGFNSDDGYCILRDDKNVPELINVTGDFDYLYDYNFKTTTLADISDIRNSNIKIFPNPAEDFVRINFKETGNYKITIFDIDGKNLITESIENKSNIEINIQDLSSGIYFISISGDISQCEKLIIE
ncbi:MAG: T9SS type A sorting domain-containing protein [Bacteroidales bacterium]|nr:T9SS type A sorting domain-containing protein [Bacteroidales bacterium]